MSKTNNQDEPGQSGYANLKRLAYFAAVVETGSFTAAAARLGITKAVVSQQVARLECEFHTSLLTRTTRKVVATEAGQAFYRRCALILREAGDAFDELAQHAETPSGTLRLTAPLDFGIAAVVPAIAEFTRRYPQCKVEAIYSDQALDLMSGQVELAIRVGWLTELHLPTRPVGSFRQVLVARADWGAVAGAISHPQALAELPFVANTALRDPLQWSFVQHALEPVHVSLQASVFLNETLAVREAVRQGMGLSVLPDFVVAQDLAAGHLVQVLPDWQLPEGGIHAVFPATRFRPTKVRAFVDVLMQRQAQHRLSA
ncbi:DNA-binding transcriptional regulator, LysR family [Lampropedia hyalina DSM 16112]|jgi:DNA-binding transcriptional LysR family regulator|uniref:DNA-binding transcriptional regulator, LysR family n=1 Tax=Lampropedia hyalina DSM 16112 TaxID=1122156 RepID=A0A1M5E914_9BURK|nr:LysR family transcriptional regulator [Lampropedia hyalina]SHF75686.1 DNA-binding transcriptional regulator, LysR family [Lampropedia hyalina DSM 16112]